MLSELVRKYPNSLCWVGVIVLGILCLGTCLTLGWNVPSGNAKEFYLYELEKEGASIDCSWTKIMKGQ